MSQATVSDDSPLDVIVIGAGFSGVCCGIKLLEQGIHDFLILEKASGVGGTWWENTYPGAVCDVASHFYCYSFEPNPDWSRLFSPQPEIQRYIEHCVDKYELRGYINNNCKVAALEFDESSNVWKVLLDDDRQLAARHVINGGGGLHLAVLPDIPGRESFQGPAMHTAHWDHSVDFADKRVAVIGSAASAIQAIPEIAKISSMVTVFQRTPNYIVPRNDRNYSEGEKARFRRLPWLNRLVRLKIFLRMDMLLYRITRRGSWYSKYATMKIRNYIRRTIKDKSLVARLIPDYTLGCKRILISDDLYETLNRDNVDVITAGIESIETGGVKTSDGTLIEADIIVFATGFDVEAHMRSLRVVGKDGAVLADTWRNGPEAYNGSCVAGFPNYYMVTGPNTGVGTTSVIFMIEQEVNYILQLIDKAGRDSLISVRLDAQFEYNTKIHEALSESVWASGCKSWYRRADGKITTLYPYNARAFQKQLKQVRFQDFNLTPIHASGEWS